MAADTYLPVIHLQSYTWPTPLQDAANHRHSGKHNHYYAFELIEQYHLFHGPEELHPKNYIHPSLYPLAENNSEIQAVSINTVSYPKANGNAAACCKSARPV
jgi:hypothetical protein